MTELEEKLLRTQSEVEAALPSIKDEAGLEALRLKYLSRKGILPGLMGQLGKVPAEEKPAVGRTLNGVKTAINAAFAAAQARLQAKGEELAAVDVTLPGRARCQGHQHPITQVMEESVAIFRRMGFIVADGPDLEDVWHNFDALNAPQDHPSRTPEDTFYFDLDKHDWLDPQTMLLRTQTSDVQIRTMMAQKPPVRIAP